MQPRLSWALPLLLAIVACKEQPTEAPEDGPSSSPAGYGELAWSESAPSRSIDPREVCEHLARMVAAEAGMSEAPIDPEMMADCEAELRIEAGVRGTDNWNDVANCVLQARTGADIDYCNRTYPLPGSVPGQPGPGPNPGGSVTERELLACDHMIEILMLESAAEMGEAPQLTSEEREALVGECARALAFEQRPQLSPDEYERMLVCIESAQSSEQMRACE